MTRSWIYFTLGTAILAVALLLTYCGPALVKPDPPPATAPVLIVLPTLIPASTLPILVVPTRSPSPEPILERTRAPTRS